MLTYKITAFNNSRGSILVSYEKDGQVFATFNVDIPLDVNNNYIVGTELDTYITNMFPIATLARMESLKAGISNASEIEKLVVTPVEPNQTTTPIV